MKKYNRLLFFILVYLIDLNAIINDINKAGGTVWNVIKQFVIDWIIKPLGYAIGKLEEYVYLIRDWLSGLINTALKLLDDTKNWLITQLTNAYNAAIKWATDSVANLWNNIKSVIDFIINNTAKLVFLCAQAFNLIYNFFTQLYNRAVMFLTQLWDRAVMLLTQLWDRLTQFITTWWNRFIWFVNDVWNRFTTLINDWWNKLVTLVNDWWNKLTWLVNQGFKFLVDFVNDPIKVLGALIFDVMKKFVDLCGEALSFVINALMNMDISRWMR